MTWQRLTKPLNLILRAPCVVSSLCLRLPSSRLCEWEDFISESSAPLIAVRACGLPADWIGVGMRGKVIAVVLNAHGVVAQRVRRSNAQGIPPWGWVLIGILGSIVCCLATIRFVWFWTYGPGALERQRRAASREAEGQSISMVVVGTPVA